MSTCCPPPSPPRAAGTRKHFPKRARQVAAMSTERRSSCSATSGSFAPLRPEDQPRIRDITSRSEAIPAGDNRATMYRYCKRFETQPPFRRAPVPGQRSPCRRVRPRPAEPSGPRICPVVGGDPADALRGNGQTIPLPGNPYRGPPPPQRPQPPGTGRLAGAIHQGTWEEKFSEENTRTQSIRGGILQASSRPATRDPPRNPLAAVANKQCQRTGCPSPRRRWPGLRKELKELSPDLYAKLEAKKPAEQVQVHRQVAARNGLPGARRPTGRFFSKRSADGETRSPDESSPRRNVRESEQAGYFHHVLKQSWSAKPPYGASLPPWHRGHYPPPEVPPLSAGPTSRRKRQDRQPLPLPSPQAKDRPAKNTDPPETRRKSPPPRVPRQNRLANQRRKSGDKEAVPGLFTACIEPDWAPACGSVRWEIEGQEI